MKRAWVASLFIIALFSVSVSNAQTASSTDPAIADGSGEAPAGPIFAGQDTLHGPPPPPGSVPYDQLSPEEQATFNQTDVWATFDTRVTGSDPWTENAEALATAAAVSAAADEANLQSADQVGVQ